MVRSDHPLNDAQIMRAAPSVFAESAHDSRSKRYSWIPTSQVLDGLRKEGFAPFMACQSKSRIPGKQEFTKHMLRLRHESKITAGSANEIILINSHDGTSSYQMLAGCFRFVCQNGLIVGDGVQDYRVRHSGDIVGNVVEGAYTVLGEFERVDQSKESMLAIALKPEQALIFAQAALEVRYDPEDGGAPIEAEQLLRPRRADDRKADLWTTFNRVQENALKGGLPGRNAKNGRTTTREVKGLDQNVRLNRALWTLAERMVQLAA
jgi:hypothetical protein